MPQSGSQRVSNTTIFRSAFDAISHKSGSGAPAVQSASRYPAIRWIVQKIPVAAMAADAGMTKR
jgi:hypothetical protein